MRIKALLLTVLLAALSFTPGCLGDGDDSNADTVPTFTLVADDGMEYGSNSLIGSNYILHFSASWCNQCRPTMHAVTNHLDNEMYLVVSTDAADGDQTKLQEWHTQVNESQDGTVSAPFGMNVGLAKDFEINNTPTLILIGKDGMVIDRHIGPLTGEAAIDEFWSQGQ
jgi:thiol-disulfide isomerase/thioredoxin